MKISAVAKFCPSCGQAVPPEPKIEIAQEMDSSAPPNTSKSQPKKKGLIVGASAALVVVVVGVAFFALRPFDSDSFDGKSASHILERLMEDGFCDRAKNRSDWEGFAEMQSLWDQDKWRMCYDAVGQIYIMAKLSPDEVAEELSTEYFRTVSGKTWVLEFSDEKLGANVIASRYGGELRN